MSESPEDVFCTLFRRVRAAHDLMTAVASLPADDAGSPPMSTRCLLSCQLLRRDIAGNIAFMEAVNCRDRLAPEDGGYIGGIWRWVDVQLMQAVSAFEKRGPDMADTLIGIARHITDIYWQLAAWIDLYTLDKSDATRRPA